MAALESTDDLSGTQSGDVLSCPLTCDDDIGRGGGGVGTDDE